MSLCFILTFLKGNNNNSKKNKTHLKLREEAEQRVRHHHHHHRHHRRLIQLIFTKPELSASAQACHYMNVMLKPHGWGRGWLLSSLTFEYHVRYCDIKFDKIMPVMFPSP